LQNLKNSRDANNCYFYHAAKLPTEDVQIGDLALMHKTKIEQSHCTMLDPSWRGPYRVTAIAQSLGTYCLAELDGAELTGWIDGSGLKKIITRKEEVHTARKISMPNTTQEGDSELFEEFEVETVAGRK